MQRYTFKLVGDYETDIETINQLPDNMKFQDSIGIIWTRQELKEMYANSSVDIGTFYDTYKEY